MRVHTKLTYILVSVPFKSLDGTSSDKFRSSLIIGDLQSAFSCISALLYLLIRRNPSHTFAQTIGLRPITKPLAKRTNNSTHHTNGSAHANSKSPSPSPPPDSTYTKSLMLKYLQCSLFITTAAPFGFAALAYITYPAMVLAKSCKLVPVILMNVLIYRRKFALHKYIVVALVTIGITAFMLFGNEQPSKVSHNKNNSKTVSAYGQAIGLTYLLINLLLDGLINSTQDQIFSQFKPTGQQMMLFINVFSTLISTTLSILPLPYIPVIHPSTSGSELGYAIEFIRTHPGVLTPLLQFALTGALGQLFIFETLQHFGSLTLV
jgi:solute carrier family 35 (UDP-galactose transporter), member B1